MQTQMFERKKKVADAKNLIRTFSKQAEEFKKTFETLEAGLNVTEGVSQVQFMKKQAEFKAFEGMMK